MVPQFAFPLLHFLLIQGLQSGHSPNSELPPSEFKFLLDVFLLFDESLSSVVFGLALEPVGGPGDALEFLGVLFSLVVLLVDLDALFYRVHGKL